MDMLTLTPMAETDFEGDGQITISWPALVQQQLINPEGWESDWEAGDIVALEDRNELTREWPGRRIFALFDDDRVFIFDENGLPLDEPDYGVPLGCQKLHGDASFVEELGVYYRLPPRSSLQDSGNGLGSSAVTALVSRAIANTLSQALELCPQPRPQLSPPPAPHVMSKEDFLARLLPQTRMVLPVPVGDGSFQLTRCTIHMVLREKGRMCYLVDNCAAKVLLLHHFDNGVELLDDPFNVLSPSGELQYSGYLTDETDVPREERAAHFIGARNGTNTPLAFLFGHDCRMGKDDSLMVMCSSKPAPGIKPVLFDGSLNPGCSVTLPGQAESFIFLRFVCGFNSKQWRNMAVLFDEAAGFEAKLFLSKVRSDDGELTLVSSSAVSEVRLATMAAQLPAFLAGMTPDSAWGALRAPPRRSIRPR